MTSNEFKDWGAGGYYLKVCDQLQTFSLHLVQLRIQLKKVEEKSMQIKSSIEMKKQEIDKLNLKTFSTNLLLIHM